MTVGGRTLRRNPLPHEVKASVDWDAMEEAWQNERASLVEQWKAGVKSAHVDALIEVIEQAETLNQLAELEAPILGEELLGDAMFAMAEEAGAQAVAEAGAQGVELDPLDSELVADEVAIRAGAQVTVMARSISQAASQKAIAEAGTGLAMSEVADFSRANDLDLGTHSSLLRYSTTARTPTALLSASAFMKACHRPSVSLARQRHHSECTRLGSRGYTRGRSCGRARPSEPHLVVLAEGVRETEPSLALSKGRVQRSTSDPELRMSGPPPKS
jgi:hypothetical protein